MGRPTKKIDAREIVEIAGRVTKLPKSGVKVHKKGKDGWSIYFGYDRLGKPLRLYVGQDKARARDICKQFMVRWESGERVQAQEIATFNTDAKDYAATQELKAQGYTLQEATDWFLNWMPIRSRHITLAEAWELWLVEAKAAGLKDRYIKTMGNMYVGPKSKFYAAFSERMIHQITPSDVQDFVYGQQKAHKDDVLGWSRNNQATHLNKLTGFFNKFIEEDGTGSLLLNPIKGITRPKNKRGEDPDEKKFYTEWQAIISMLEFAITGKPRTLGRRQFGLVIMFVVFGGVRLEETVRLKWKDLQKNDEGLWEITVSEADSKTDRKVNAFAAKPSTWVDQFVALLGEQGEILPDNPIITQSRNINAAVDEDEIKQRQKRFRHQWKEHCGRVEDTRWEDQKTVAQNGLRHAGACYGFYIYGQDELMNRMGDRDAKLLERAYRKYVKKSEALKFFNVPSLAIRQDHEQKIEVVMALDDGLSREDAIKLLKGETLADGRWFADGQIWTSNNNG